MLSNNELLHSLINEPGDVWEEAHADELAKQRAILAPVRVSLFRKLLVNSTDGISRKGDVLEVMNIFTSRCAGNNETAQMTVWRNGKIVRTTATATVTRLNMMIAAGELSLITE